MLAGLNLREVADEAGVNRGLVYHYFGSRRDLLRAAARPDVGDASRDLRRGRGCNVRDRYERFFRTMLDHRQAVVLSALLVLDGDKGAGCPDPDGVARAARPTTSTRARCLADVDVIGMHAAVASLVYGYTALRDRLADELSVDADDLDERVASTVGRLVGRLAPDPAHT